MSIEKMSTEKTSVKKESKVEVAKRQGDYLRGTIRDVLTSEVPSFDHDDIQLLKFHGIYQQDDRDVRQARRATGKEKEFSFMVRTRIPGGRLSAEQYLALDQLADAVSSSHSLRITSRQTFQFHGVVKGRLKETIAAIDRALISTLAACGDVGRNVMAPPAPFDTPAYRSARRLADEISTALTPRSRAYHEIWLDGEKVVSSDDEPLYGSTYLPRKFKVGVALPDDNTVDVFTQDVGLIAVADDAGAVHAVNVLVGGGMGMTHRKADTFARLGTPLGAVAEEQAVAVVRAIAEVFRDHGNRGDRKHARLKYLIEDWGEARFRQAVARQAGLTLAPWVEVEAPRMPSHHGAHAQGDGRFFYGIYVENGRLLDVGRRRLKSALRAAVEALQPRVVLSPNQDILLADLTDEDVSRLETILEAYGVETDDTLSGARRFSIACPALPTCGLALAESERFMPEVLADLEAELAALGLAEVPMSVRMTGCPNGCARPYTADIGFVGRRGGHYDLYVGGRRHGDRLAELFAEQVPAAALMPTLRPLLEQWQRQRLPDEELGDFYQRCFGTEEQRHILTGAKEPAAAARARSLPVAV